MEAKNKSETKSSGVKISLMEHLTDQMFTLCMSAEYADVEFIVEGQRIPSHRLILAKRSEYFRALLFGGMSETHQREVSLSVPLLPFKALLVYFYTGQLLVAFGDNESASLLDILELANEYLLHDLMSAISKELCAHLSVDNIIIILKAVQNYEMPELSEACFKFIDRHALEVLKHDSIKYLTTDSVIEIIKRDSFCVADIEIFRMIVRWKQHNPDVDDIETIFSNVRFSLMIYDDLVTVVQDSNLLDPKTLLKLITDKTLSTTFPHRTRFWENEVLSVSSVSGVSTGHAIIFKLTDYSMINFIELTLRIHDYVNIEVSIDEKNWENIVPYAFCNPCHKLNFIARKVLFVRISPTNGNNQVTVSELKPMYLIPK